MLIVMALLATGGTYLLVSALGTTNNRTVADREHNARVLGEAKQALLGWAAQNALDSGDANPGRLPCPAATEYAGVPGCEGRSAPGLCQNATTLVWVTSTTCSAVGRLPWRTLGLPKLTDASGEELWYSVSNGWSLSTTASTLKINSDTAGQITVDGQPNSAVALIIAPGIPLAVQSSANCTARTQQRTAASPDYRDYLECQNAASPAGVTATTSGPSGSFNDQVVQIRTADVMPAIEASIAKRIERDIAPVLKTVYAGAEWGLSTVNTVLPYAAPFTNPHTSNYQGSLGQTQGLLPVSYYRSPGAGCPASPVDPRCTTTAVAWGNPGGAKTGGSGSLRATPICHGGDSTTECVGSYQDGTITIAVSDPALRIATAMRTFDPANHTVTVRAWRHTYSRRCGCWTTRSMSATRTAVSRVFNSDGSVSFVATVSLPRISGSDWGSFQIDTTRPGFSDHAVLDTANATTGWFLRNDWHKSVYYAIAPSQAASGAAPRNCRDDRGNCLSVTNLAGANKRAVLVLGGRNLANQARPSGNLTDYLENAENRDGNTTFTQDKVGPATNDRIVVLDQSS